MLANQQALNICKDILAFLFSAYNIYDKVTRHEQVFLS